MRLAFLAAAVLVAACRQHEDAPPSPPSPKAGPPPPPAAEPSIAHHHYELRRDELVDGFYWKCSVVDTTTHQVVGHATGQNVAAGGTTIECTDFAADGKVIVFSNSRGSIAAAPSPKRRMPRVRNERGP